MFKISPKPNFAISSHSGASSAIFQFLQNFEFAPEGVEYEVGQLKIELCVILYLFNDFIDIWVDFGRDTSRVGFWPAFFIIRNKKKIKILPFARKFSKFARIAVFCHELTPRGWISPFPAILEAPARFFNFSRILNLLQKAWLCSWAAKNRVMYYTRPV